MGKINIDAETIKSNLLYSDFILEMSKEMGVDINTAQMKELNVFNQFLHSSIDITVAKVNEQLENIINQAFAKGYEDGYEMGYEDGYEMGYG
jgi:flagellar biosynthesis/type III secretory pathway protein FliH